MRHLKFIIAVVVGGGLAAVSWQQHSRNENLRRDNDMLRAVIAERKDLAGRDRPVSTGEPLTRDQSQELLKLRSEAARLRELTNQIGALVEANQKLASFRELKASELKKEKQPEDALPQDIHPRDSWAFRGYGSPDDTLESMVWATVKKDRARFLGGMAPQLRAEWEKQFSEVEIDDKDTSEFRILDRQIKSDDLVVMTVYTTLKRPGSDDLHKIENTFFQRIDGEWRVADSAVTPK
jgi:hypothetical protein